MSKLPAIVTAVALLAFQQAPAAEPLRLENGTLALRFDAASGTLAAIENKLVGETYAVSGDGFAVETTQGTVALSDTALKSLQHDSGSVSVRYEGKGLTVEVRHFLGRGKKQWDVVLCKGRAHSPRQEEPLHQRANLRAEQTVAVLLDEIVHVCLGVHISFV